MGGFLQDFDEQGLLGQRNLAYVHAGGYNQGLHLAMLGMSQQAHAIFELLHRHKLEPWPGSVFETAIRFFYHVSGLKSPFEDDFEDEDIPSMQLEAIKGQSCEIYRTQVVQLDLGLDLSVVTEAHYQELSNLAAQVMDGERNRMKLPQMLMCLAYEAHVLGRDADLQHYFSTIATFIDNRRQIEVFSVLFFAWGQFFLNGRLRDALGLQVPQLSDYGDFVLRMLTRRLEDGPVHSDHMYAGMTIRELVGELDRNTMSDPDFNPYDYWFSDEDGGPKTILKKPATDEAIAAAEEKMGRALPEQLKAFLKLTNGLHWVKIGPGLRKMKFVAVEEMYLESNDYMDDYNFSLLPDFTVESKKEEKDCNGAKQNEDDSKDENEEEKIEDNTNGELDIKADGNEESGTRKDGNQANAGEVDEAAENEKEAKDDDNQDDVGDPNEDDDDDNSLEIPWLKYSDGGGIAMYEHDGQGTEYTWIIPKRGVDVARERIATVYARVDDEQKRRIDQAIVHRYGSREAYDTMEYCIWVQLWGSPNGQEVHPSFESYLRACVYDGRVRVERSPLGSRV